MKTTIRTVVFAALMGFVATASSASFFDGKRPLLCSVYQLFECDAPNACLAVTPEQIGGVSHLNIDFKNKTITRAGVESKQTSMSWQCWKHMSNRLSLSCRECSRSCSSSCNSSVGAMFTQDIFCHLPD